MVEPLAAGLPADAPAAPCGKTLEPGVKPAETVRVDIGRLDQLMDLAGQLVIGKARVTQIAERLKKGWPTERRPAPSARSRQS